MCYLIDVTECDGHDKKQGVENIVKEWFQNIIIFGIANLVDGFVNHVCDQFLEHYVPSQQ